MQLKIKHNLGAIPKLLSGLTQKQIAAATYRATNETARRVKKSYSMAIRQQINLPATGKSSGKRGRTAPGVKDMLQVTLAARPSRGKAINSIFATIGTDNKPISLIHFV